MDQSFRIAGLVVLYRPAGDLMTNIRSYLGQVKTLFVVDNSEPETNVLAPQIEALPDAVYLPNNRNLGIAKALNIGAAKAIELGFDFLLTMDQDSTASPDMVKTMLECLKNRDISKVGIISPFHHTKSGHAPGSDPCQEVMTPMTSGNLLNLRAYQAVGTFRDDFFIDFVDNEYCLRLRQQGFSVIRANRATLKHSVGDTKKYGPFIATNHSALRRYYKTRNRFWVFRQYFSAFPGHCLFDMVRLLKEIGSILLFEQYKFLKLRMMWRGWDDYRQNRFGRYEQ